MNGHGCRSDYATATATLQRLMAQVLRNIKNKHGNLVLCYVDDILIATATIEEHLERIQEVLAALEAAGLKLKASKCNFMDTEIKFLGRKISAKGIQPDPESVQKVQEWDPPRNKNEVASFLGLANYYSNFIDKFAEISAPLNKLRAKNVRFEWTDDCQQAFETLKEKLCQEPILTLPNETGKFYLDTDASIVAISGHTTSRTRRKWGKSYESNSICQQGTPTSRTEIWSSETGNVSSYIPHRTVPEIPVTHTLLLKMRQSCTELAENVLDVRRHVSKMDTKTGTIPLHN